MSFYLLSVEASPAVRSGATPGYHPPSVDLATRQLANAGFRVMRAWNLPASDTAYVVVRGDVDRLTVSGAIRRTSLSLRGAAEIVAMRHEELAADDYLERTLPSRTPESLTAVARLLDAGYAPIDPPLEWCNDCETFHERGKHVA